MDCDSRRFFEKCARAKKIQKWRPWHCQNEKNQASKNFECLAKVIAKTMIFKTDDFFENKNPGRKMKRKWPKTARSAKIAGRFQNTNSSKPLEKPEVFEKNDFSRRAALEQKRGPALARWRISNHWDFHSWKPARGGKKILGVFFAGFHSPFEASFRNSAAKEFRPKQWTVGCTVFKTTRQGRETKKHGWND